MSEVNLGQGSNYLVKTTKPVAMWDTMTVIKKVKRYL